MTERVVDSGRYNTFAVLLASAVCLNAFYLGVARADDPAPVHLFSAGQDVSGRGVARESVESARIAPAGTAPAAIATSGARSRALKLNEAFKLNEEGVELILKGDRNRGVQRLNRALEQDSTNTTALYNLAGVKLEQGDARGAIKPLERAIAIAPDDLSFLNRLAEAHFANSNIDNATEYYQQIVETDPAFGEASLRLGVLYGMNKDWERAETQLRKAVELNPSDPRALGNLGNILVLREKFDEATRLLTKAQKMKRTPENAVALGIAAESAGNTKRALDHFREAKLLGDRDTNLDKHILELEQLLAGQPTESRSQ